MGEEKEAGLESTASSGDVAEATGTPTDENGPEAGTTSGSGKDAGAETGNGQASVPGVRPDEANQAKRTRRATEPASGEESAVDEGSPDARDDAPEDERAKLAEEVLRYKERWVRLAAEFDNYKKRTGREFTALVKNAGESLITELLPILDNMERALQAPQTSEETRSFAEGFEMIRQQLTEKLEKAGLKEIAAEGEVFDPTRHEAVMAVENEDHPPDTVINVVEKGYTLNEKVLRAAKVIVTRTAAKAPDQDDDQAAGSGKDE